MYTKILKLGITSNFKTITIRAEIFKSLNNKFLLLNLLKNIETWLYF